MQNATQRDPSFEDWDTGIKNGVHIPDYILCFKNETELDANASQKEPAIMQHTSKCNMPLGA